MKKKILITAALPYANGPLHFGHLAGAYLPADCYARFERLAGKQVLFISGTDEHGVAITLSAENAGRTPHQHVDFYHGELRKFFEKMQISFDHFSRTTWEGHIPTVQAFFLDLLNNGYIEPKITDQLYSEQEKRFLADRYVVGICPRCQFERARGDECPKCGSSFEATDLKNPRSKLTGSPLVLKPTQHWFLRFDLFKEKLSEWLKTKQWKSNVLHFAKNYVEDLKPRAITRDSGWGVPIPLEEAKDKVFYVWFDAPIGYISATKEWAVRQGKPDLWKDYWLDSETKMVEFLGKDNIPFHAVFFPAMIMGQNTPYNQVDELPANEFLNLEGRQFSKSDGWYIDLERFFKQFTVDQIRYYLAANSPESQDAEFTWKDFQNRCNSELLNKYGNLAQRTLVFIQGNCGGVIPSMESFGEDEERFVKNIALLTEEASAAYSAFHLRRAASLIMELAALGNGYFDNKKPWMLVKDPKKRGELDTVLACCLECLKCLALISSPIIPNTAQKLWEMLGFETHLEKQRWTKVVEEKLKEGRALPSPQRLFQRVEDSVIEEEMTKLKGPTQESIREISFEEFKKMELRAGEILAVERVPKSQKLLKLTVDIGTEKRTIVSGIAPFFEEIDQLIGKRVVVVANLKPVKFMGVESQGMVLAADLPHGLELLSLEKATPGCSIH